MNIFPCRLRTLGWIGIMSFNLHKSHTLSISLQKDHLANPPIYFLNNHLEVLVIQNPGSHYRPWSFLGKPHFGWLGILRRSQSFFGTPEPLSTYNTSLEFPSVSILFTPCILCIHLVHPMHACFASCFCLLCPDTFSVRAFPRAWTL